MIKIIKESLDQGLDLLEIAKNCPNSHNCLWLKRSGLFQIPNALPKRCPRENCEVIIFRKTFENNSPAFYAEALRLSRFHDVARTTIAMAIQGKVAERKKLSKITRRTHDLHIFGQLLVLAIYPLFLEAKEIPFLKPAEIVKLRNNYGEAEIRQTIKKMGEIYLEWFMWVTSVMKNLLSNHEDYPSAIMYLVYSFLMGIEKDQLPDLENMTQDEKNKFF